MTCHAHALARSRRFLTVEDVDLLVKLSRMLPGPHPLVYNLGAGSGTTALAVLEACPAAFVESVDISQDNLNWTREAVTNAGFHDRHSHLLHDTREGPWQPVPPVDMLLIDTSHEEEATRTELRLWLPAVRPGGFVWLHDTDGEEYPGVRVALLEALAAGRLLLLFAEGLGTACLRLP